MKRHNCCIALIIVDFLQMASYVTHQKWLKGLGAVTVASPLPIVFTQVGGVETFAQDFYVHYTDEYGKRVRIQITPQLYANLHAPYNYRNVLGAAVSYGPVLPEPIWRSVLHHALVEPGTLAKAMGLPDKIDDHAIFIRTRTQGRTNTWTLKLNPAP